MVSREVLDNLIKELEQAWADSTERISKNVEREIAKKGGITKINPKILTDTAIEIEAAQRAQAITKSVVRALLTKIEELEGRIENLESRIQTLGSPGPSNTL